MKKLLSLSGFFLVFIAAAFAQTEVKVGILGSSTAAGNGSTQDSSWAARLQASFRKNTSDNRDTVVLNFGYPGYVTYKGMPASFVFPADRTQWGRDPLRNVDKMIDTGARMVILNYPSNDVFLYPNYTTHETVENLRLMYQRLTGAGVRTFVTTSQPRQDASINPQQQQWLRDLRDSIVNAFGYYAVNVWDTLAQAGTNLMKPEVNADNIHPNNTGHRYIYQQVAAKQLFGPEAAPLPVKVTDFRGQHERNGIRLTWRVAGEEPGTSYEVQRSSNGRSFSTIHTLGSTGAASYSHMDAQPGPGDHFYRLLIREANRTTYTPIVKLNAGKKDLYIQGLQLSGSLLNLDVGAANAGLATLSIVSMNGAEVLRKEVRVAPAGSSLQVAVDRLAPGEYVLTLRTATAQAAQRFVKH